MKLFRYFQNPLCTLGILVINKDHPPIFVLELPWRKNETDVSCIPTGTYGIKPFNSSIHKECYKLLNVPERTDVLIHIGNYLKDTKGCILPGLGVNTSIPMTQNSTRAMDIIRDQVGPRQSFIEIVNL